MGSAEEPETLQLWKQETIPEDAHHPHSVLPCSQETDRFPKNIICDRGDLIMRNCYVNDLSIKGSSQEDTMVDNPNQNNKNPLVDMMSSVDLAAETNTVALKSTVTEGAPLEGGDEITAHQDLLHNSPQDLSLKEPLSTSTNTFPSLDSQADSATGEACQYPPAELCERGAKKDSSSSPVSLKHVVFLEPKADTESISAGTLCSKEGPMLSTCLQSTSQGQTGASEGGTPHFGEPLNEGHGGGSASEAPKESLAELIVTEATSKTLAGTGTNHLGSTEGQLPTPETFTKVGADSVPGILPDTIPHEVKLQDTSGESQTTLRETTKETEKVREASPSNTNHQNLTQEQPKTELATMTVNEEHGRDTETDSVEPVAKTCSFELTPPQHDAGTQAGHQVSLVSVAISPINPPDGSTAFTFHSGGLGVTSLKSPGPEQKPAKKDVEMQVSIPVETRSVATGPMTPVTKSPQASYPEVHIKGAQEEAPEPVREVSWDEKGMTWEVYGASMEVEVLGMAIQKHLEKQIEEHGRQMVMSPQSTRASSIKGPPHKGEIKRQPGVFRSLLQNMRRPHCCSRGGPAVE